jgi:hypothetical protein
MPNYTWSYPALGVVYNEDTLTDVVQTINWVLTATDGEYSASCYGSITLGAPDPENFTPYAELTEAQVTEWTIQSLGEEQVSTYEASLAGQIEAQKNPTSGNMAPPWSA